MAKRKITINEEGKLSDRQKRFIAAYVVSGNGLKAAREAGYTGSDAVVGVRATKLKKNPIVAKALAAYEKETMNEKRLEREEVLRKVADNLHRDLTDLCDDKGIIFDRLTMIPKRAHAFIDGLKVKQIFGTDEDGDRIVVGQEIEIKLCSNAAVQDMAMKFAGLYTADKKLNINGQIAAVDFTRLFVPPQEENDPVEQAIIDLEGNPDE